MSTSRPDPLTFADGLRGLADQIAHLDIQISEIHSLGLCADTAPVAIISSSAWARLASTTEGLAPLIRQGRPCLLRAGVAWLADVS